MSSPDAQNSGSSAPGAFVAPAPNAPSPTGPSPYASVQPPQAPTPRSKSRSGLWIGLGAAVVVIAAVAISIPLIVGAVQHGDAEREFDAAQTEVDEARMHLVEALQTATTEASSSQAFEGALSADRVADPAVFERLATARGDLAVAAGLSIDPETGAVAAHEAAIEDSALSGDEVSVKPDGVEGLRAAAAQLGEEAAALRAETELIETAGAELWEAQLGVLDSAQQKGNELLAEASEKAGEAEAAALQKAIDALDSAELTRGETDLGILLGGLNAAWDAVQASMVPEWADLNGTWCGGYQGDCITIDLTGLNGTSGSTMTYREMWGGCFNGLAVAKNGIGGAQVLYCPSGVPTTVESSGPSPSEPFVLNEDASRDRVLFFQAPGGHWYFRQ